MKRRQFIAGLGGAVAWPLAARAQQGDRVRRIGVLIPYDETDSEAKARVAAFREGLEKLGWTEGGNISFDYRWALDTDRLRAYATGLVAMTPDAIFAVGGAPLVALQKATQTIPIVFAAVPDPVANGFVASVARPGGNITGFATYELTIGVKWLELLKEIAPRVTGAAFIYDPANPNSSGYLREIEAAAPSLGMKVSAQAVHNSAEIERMLDLHASALNSGLIVLASPAVNANRKQIIALAAKHRLPAIYHFRESVAEGGLASYGADIFDLSRRAAIYVDRILKGDKPSDLPVQFATRFELVINLKTAKALGLTVPQSILLRADEVIE
jgi:putative tryptophan/tyrosine transport system substrate-binding protein